MSTKAAILATVGIGLGLMVLSIILMVLFIDIHSRHAEERAAMLGQGVAMVGFVPLLIIWILWAMRVRKERDAKQANKT